MTQVINTVSVYLSLLQDKDYDIKKIAIQQLLSNINLHWTDIANDIDIMYSLPYLVKNFWMILTLKTNKSLLYYCQKYTSI